MGDGVNSCRGEPVSQCKLVDWKYIGLLQILMSVQKTMAVVRIIVLIPKEALGVHALRWAMSWDLTNCHVWVSANYFLVLELWVIPS